MIFKFIILIILLFFCGCSKNNQSFNFEENFLLNELSSSYNKEYFRVCKSYLNEDELNFVQIKNILLPYLNNKEELVLYWENYLYDETKSPEKLANYIHYLHELLQSISNQSNYLSDEAYIRLYKYIHKLNSELMEMYNKEKFEFELFNQNNINYFELNNRDFSMVNSALSAVQVEEQALVLVDHFLDSVEKIRNEHNLASNYILLLTDNSKVTPVSGNGKVRASIDAGVSDVKFTQETFQEVHFISQTENELNASDIIIVKIFDQTVRHNIQKFKDFLNQNIQVLKPYVSVKNSQLMPENDFNDSIALNAGLAISAIFNYLEFKRSWKKDESNAYYDNIYKLIMSHNYLSFSQMSADAAQATADFVLIYNSLQLADIQQHAAFYARLGRTVNIASNVISFAAVGLDIAEIAYSQSATEVMQFSTQLGFDSFGLGMGLSNLILRGMGAMTASAIVGSLSVPLAGLAIGLSGFVSATTEAQEGAIAQARYFFEYENDYKNFNPIPIETSPQVIPLAYKNVELNSEKGTIAKADYTNVIIKKVDLSDDEHLKLEFGTQYLYETKKNMTGDSCLLFCEVRAGTNKQTALAINEELALPTGIEYKFNDSRTVVVLPIMPQSFVRYFYNFTPLITTRNDAELKTARRLTRSQRFLFEFSGPLGFSNAVRRIDAEYASTEIAIMLGEYNRILITPAIPPKIQNKIKYKVKSKEGHYYLKVLDAASYSLETNGNEKWFIDASEVDFSYETFLISEQLVQLGKLKIEFPTAIQPNELIFALKDGTMFSVLLKNKDKKLLVVDFQKFKELYANENILNKLKILAAGDEYRYIELEHFNVSGGQIKAWYDTRHNEILYPKNPLTAFHCVENNNCININSVMLLERSEQHILYYSNFSQNLFYQPDSNAAMFEVVSNIIKLHKRNDSVYIIETLDKHLISYAPAEGKKLLALKKSNATPQDIQKIANKYSYVLAKEVSIFNADGRFVGYYEKDFGAIQYIHANILHDLNTKKIRQDWNAFFY